MTQQSPDIAQLAPVILKMWLGQSPILLVCLIGMVVALMNWRFHPLPAALACAAFGLRFILTLGVPAVHFIIARGSSPDTGLIQAVSILSTLIGTVVYVLFILAIFTGRPRQTSAGQT